MDGWRKQRWDKNNRRWINRKPPRGHWQNTVPSWEKDFCKKVGTFNWETFLNMKTFMHLYDDVIKWNDSAGEEAFCNAKKRYWAEINGVSCDIPMPDPDLYIDEINWDLDELSPDLEFDPAIPSTEDHDPVIIFGDSLFTGQLPVTGWGDDERNFEVPANHSAAGYGEPSLVAIQKLPATGWGDDEENLQVPANRSAAGYGDPWEPSPIAVAMGWGDDEKNLQVPANHSTAGYGDPWEPSLVAFAMGWGDGEKNLQVPANRSTASYRDPWEQSLAAFQNLPATGWSDDEKNLQVPADHSAAGYGDQWEQSLVVDQKLPATGWGDDEENLQVPANHSSAGYGGSWEQTWGVPLNNNTATGSAWPVYSNNAWEFGGGSGQGHVSWEGDWEYPNNHFGYAGNWRDDRQQELWNNSNATKVNAGGYKPSFRTPRVQGNDNSRNRMPRNETGRYNAAYRGKQSIDNRGAASKEWNSMNSCGPVGRRAAVTAGRAWNQDKSMFLYRRA